MWIARMQIMSVRPDHVSAEVWLLSIALSSLVPAAIYVGMTWRVLHRMNRGRQESDQAVAVVAALCVKNGATIEKFMMLLDGLDSHPSIGESLLRQQMLLICSKCHILSKWRCTDFMGSSWVCAILLQMGEFGGIPSAMIELVSFCSLFMVACLL